MWAVAGLLAFLLHWFPEGRRQAVVSQLGLSFPAAGKALQLCQEWAGHLPVTCEATCSLREAAAAVC